MIRLSRHLSRLNLNVKRSFAQQSSSGEKNSKPSSISKSSSDAQTKPNLIREPDAVNLKASVMEMAGGLAQHDDHFDTISRLLDEKVLDEEKVSTWLSQAKDDRVVQLTSEEMIEIKKKIMEREGGRISHNGHYDTLSQLMDHLILAKPAATKSKEITMAKPTDQ